jgi:hypothetical protein
MYMYYASSPCLGYSANICSETKFCLYQRGLNTKRLTLVFFLAPTRNLSNHMDRQARTGDTVLVKSREMTGRSQTLPWWLKGRGGKDDRKQNTLATLACTNSNDFNQDIWSLSREHHDCLR